MFDVSKCIMRNDELPLMQEFYRQQDYRKFQKRMLKEVNEEILGDIKEKRGEGNDFNSILLIQNENNRVTKRAKLVRRYMTQLML